jgi:hypothetical protein
MRARVYFLIFVTLLVCRLPLWESALVLVGYYLCEHVDRWLVHRAKDRIFDEEILPWEKDPEDPTEEIKGNLTRFRLEDEHQRIVTRIAEFIRRLD